MNPPNSPPKKTHFLKISMSLLKEFFLGKRNTVRRQLENGDIEEAQKCVLLDSITDVHENFKREYPNVQMERTMFFLCK